MNQSNAVANGPVARRGPGRREGRKPRGRTVDPTALAEIGALLGDRPRRRDLLIEHLHLIQDRYGTDLGAHLGGAGRGDAARLAEVYEVATFYAHFDVVKEGDRAAAAAHGPRLRQHHLRDVRRRGASEPTLQGGPRAPKSASCARPCVGLCDQAPGRRGRDTTFCIRRDPASVASAVAAGRPHPDIPDAISTTTPIVRGGGYALLERLRSGELQRRRRADGPRRQRPARARRRRVPDRAQVALVRGEPGPRLMAVNADEGEPGTFKDRHYLDTDPHRFLEGMLIAAQVVEAAEIYIYLRDEYPDRARDPARARSPGCRRGRTAASHLRRGRRGLYLRRGDRRCSRASRASAGCRGTSRPSRPRSACSAARR